MRRWIMPGVLVGIGLLLSGCGPLVENIARNRTLPDAWEGCVAPHQQACEAHRDGPLVLVDTHTDSLMWGRNLRRMHSFGHADLPRLRTAGIDFQILGVPNSTPFPGKSRDTGRECVEKPGLADSSNLVALFRHTTHVSTWFSPRERAMQQAADFRSLFIDRPEPGFIAIRDRSDLMRWQASLSTDQPLRAAMLSLEGIHWFDDESLDAFAEENGITGPDARDRALRQEVEQLAAAGFRMVSLNHRFNNALSLSPEDCALIDDDSADKKVDTGLTPQGKKALRMLLDAGLIIDVAHASQESTKDILDLVAKYFGRDKHKRLPIMMSHGGVAQTCYGGKDVNAPTSGETGKGRNLSNATIRAILQARGVIGIGVWPEAVCFDWETATTPRARVELVLSHVLKAMKTVVAQAKVLGEGVSAWEHLALGSDYDGAVLVPTDVRGFAPMFTAFLDEHGCELVAVDPSQFSDRDRAICTGETPRTGPMELTRAIVGENVINLLKEVLSESYPALDDT